MTGGFAHKNGSSLNFRKLNVKTDKRLPLQKASIWFRK